MQEGGLKTEMARLAVRDVGCVSDHWMRQLETRPAFKARKMRIIIGNHNIVGKGGSDGKRGRNGDGD